MPASMMRNTRTPWPRDGIWRRRRARPPIPPGPARVAARGWSIGRWSARPAARSRPSIGARRLGRRSLIPRVSAPRPPCCRPRRAPRPSRPRLRPLARRPARLHRPHRRLRPASPSRPGRMREREQSTRQIPSSPVGQRGRARVRAPGEVGIVASMKDDTHLSPTLSALKGREGAEYQASMGLGIEAWTARRRRALWRAP